MIKTPISYYGGKQRIIKEILALIPEHSIYCEPFFGGGAVFFAKAPAKCEMINDINSEVINFYKVYQNDKQREELFELVKNNLISRKQHEEARSIYRKPDNHSEVSRAWAFWTLATTSFNSDFYGNIKFTRNPERGNTWMINSKSNLLNEKVIRRIETTQIDCREASLVINAMDTKDTFHFCDPPYIDCDQGHYYGYTETHFRSHLDTLMNIKGKFLLTCYENDIIYDYVERHKLNYQLIKLKCSASAVKGIKPARVEMLTYNYEIHNSLSL